MLWVEIILFLFYSPPRAGHGWTITLNGHIVFTCQSSKNCSLWVTNWATKRTLGLDKEFGHGYTRSTIACLCHLYVIFSWWENTFLTNFSRGIGICILRHFVATIHVTNPVILLLSVITQLYYTVIDIWQFGKIRSRETLFLIYLKHFLGIFCTAIPCCSSTDRHTNILIQYICN